MERKEILSEVRKLYQMWKRGELGGEKMPEDSNPALVRGSEENLLYFTLPMALNYQRNSYKLWESALKTYADKSTNFVFNPAEAIKREQEVKAALTKFRLALQPNKQTEIWLTLCKSITRLGGLGELFALCDNDVNKIRAFIQQQHKKEFPYLSGNKICNYWLYVLHQYTDIKFKNLQDLTVAPDTHVIQASKRLALVSGDEKNLQEEVAKRWKTLLSGTEFCPIDIHTPLWLWSRNGFAKIK